MTMHFHAPQASTNLGPGLRSDLIRPVVIFGGVFLISAAFCGAIDSVSSSTSFVEEVKVVRAEGAAGGHDADLLVSCKHESRSALSEIRCRSQRYHAVSLH